MERRMMPLAWKAELRAPRKFAFSTRLGKLITYHVPTPRHTMRGQSEVPEYNPTFLEPRAISA